MGRTKIKVTFRFKPHLKTKIIEIILKNAQSLVKLFSFAQPELQQALLICLAHFKNVKI